MRQDILRLENYGITPNERVPDIARSHGNMGRPRHNYEYEYEYEFVNPNSKRLSLERGDVFRFSSSVRPEYARNQMGMIIDRYRKVKHKGIKYIDYCAVVMVITGPQKGRVFRFSMNHAGQLDKTIGGQIDD